MYHKTSENAFKSELVPIISGLFQKTLSLNRRTKIHARFLYLSAAPFHLKQFEAFEILFSFFGQMSVEATFWFSADFFQDLNYALNS